VAEFILVLQVGTTSTEMLDFYARGVG